MGNNMGTGAGRPLLAQHFILVRLVLVFRSVSAFNSLSFPCLKGLGYFCQLQRLELGEKWQGPLFSPCLLQGIFSYYNKTRHLYLLTLALTKMAWCRTSCEIGVCGRSSLEHLFQHQLALLSQYYLERLTSQTQKTLICSIGRSLKLYRPISEFMWNSDVREDMWHCAECGDGYVMIGPKRAQHLCPLSEGP